MPIANTNIDVSAIDDDDEEDSAAQYLKRFAKVLFSHVGLGILVIGYVVIGAFLFMYIEGEDEKTVKEQGLNRSRQIEDERDQLANTLWDYKWSNVYNQSIEALLDEYHNNVTEAIDKYDYKGMPENESDISYGWGFPSALLFTVSVVTTIGYGHVAPKSEIGQIVVILYSLVGVPLMLMFLANIGDAMANFFRNAYGRGCCYCCNSRRQKEYERAREEAARGRRSSVGDLPHKPRDAWSADRKKRSRSHSPDRRDFDPENPRDDEARVLTDDEIEALASPDADSINVPISLTLVVIAAYVFIGAVLFAAWNDWSWITGAYFSFVTLSTIGFGDLVPGWSEMGTTEGKVKLAVSAFYIVLGLAVLSMAFNLMMEEMVEKFKWVGRKMGIIEDSPDDAIPDKVPLVDRDDMTSSQL